MKIGIFDSGLGGLVITHALVKKLSQYDFVYLGDTARAPYGNRTKADIYQYTQQGLEFLFKQGCKLVIVACNTASADALRVIQQSYLPSTWPDRKALGVLIPSAEVAVQKGRRIGIIATTATIKSMAFDREIKKLLVSAVIYHKATPLLVPNIEADEMDIAEANLKIYLKQLLKNNIDTLVLGCTHYPLLKARVAQIVGPGINIISQDDIIPSKLSKYLSHHPEISSCLTQNSTIQYFVTKHTPTIASLAIKLFGSKVMLKEVII